MSIDPLQLVEMARPQPSANASSFTPQRGATRRTRDTIVEDHEGNQRSLSELATVPNSPTYNSKIPNPPCLKCNADHNPITEARGGYDHAYVRMEEPTDKFIGPGIPAPASALVPSAPATVLASPSTKRISVFPGRGEDDYILVVERRENDDWEDDYKQKVSGDTLAKLLPILRALDTKLKDRTGGDLVELGERKLS